MLMDAHELEGDRQAGMTTPAVALGQARARWLGVALMTVATMCLIGIAKGPFGKILAVVSILSLLCVLLWPRIEEERRIEFSRLPMLAAALAVATR